MWLLINVYYKKYAELGTLKGYEPIRVMDDSAEYIHSSNTLQIF